MAFPNESITKYQKMVWDIYGISDDRLYSNRDLLSNMERFTMWALKGIRKGKIGDLHISLPSEKPENTSESFSHFYSTAGIQFNLIVATAWFFALLNRLHINLEKELWQRFPNMCSYCKHMPCSCQTWKDKEFEKIKSDDQSRPNTMAEFQSMFRKIYPPEKRTLEHAGVHLAEELGELSEALHLFEGTHKKKYFTQLEIEAADFFSCILGVANSIDFDFADSFYKLIPEKCHVCGQGVCVCNFF
ncbi:MAG: hypothetical protein PHC97_02245 [Patescibacteria group bacterium]|nr:hypothetical protein [Patescibacteria group bacterium]